MVDKVHLRKGVRGWCGRLFPDFHTDDVSRVTCRRCMRAYHIEKAREKSRRSAQMYGTTSYNARMASPETLRAFSMGVPIIIYSDGATISLRLKQKRFYGAPFHYWLRRAIAVAERDI